MRTRPSKPFEPAAWKALPIPTPMTLLPLRWPESFFFCRPVEQLAALDESVFEIRAGQLALGVFAFEAVVVGRIDAADFQPIDAELRAASSSMGSIVIAVWFSPGPRCGPRGGVLVSTAVPRQRIASG